MGGVALASLVEQFQPWIHSITRRMWRKYQKYYEYDDLFSTACITAVEAEKTFDPSIGKFAAYIKPRIEGAITRSVSNISNIQHQAFNKMSRFIEKYLNNNGRVPAQHIIMEHLGMKEQEFTSLLEATNPVTIVSPDFLSEDELSVESDSDVQAEFYRVSKVLHKLSSTDQERIRKFMETPTMSSEGIKDILAIIRDELGVEI